MTSTDTVVFTLRPDVPPRGGRHRAEVARRRRIATRVAVAGVLLVIVVNVIAWAL